MAQVDPALEQVAAEKRNFIHKQIPSGSSEKVVFSRRKPKERGARPKFYFFSADHENLLVCATAKKLKNGTTFKMSTSSKDIKKKSTFYVGLCSDFQQKNQFIGYKVFPERPNLFISVIRTCCDIEQVHLTPSNAKPDFQFPPTDSLDEKAKIPTLTYGVEDAADSEETGFQSIVVKTKKDEPILTITQKAAEEYEVDIRGPMSIYQAFCATCVLTAV